MQNESGLSSDSAKRRRDKSAMWYVYILECQDKRTYVGCTDDLRDRFKRHQKGFVEATKTRLPVTLFGYFAINNKEKAYRFEKYLKTGSGRVFLQKRLF